MDGLSLPGFRFHPNEEELLNFYLTNAVYGCKLRHDIIGFLDIYNHDPRELPGLAKIGEREWYFFVCRDNRKHGTSAGRPSRTTKTGFWKATGSDKKVVSPSSSSKVLLGHRKTLVFYEGRAPRGVKTDWVMNEYRLPNHGNKCTTNSKDIVLCKIYKKATPLKVLEQRAAVLMEEDEDDNEEEQEVVNKVVVEVAPSAVADDRKEEKQSSRCSIIVGSGSNNLGELQVPKFNVDWKQDYFWMMENLSPFLPLV